MVAEQRKKSVVDHPPTLLGGTAIKPPGWDRTGWEAVRYKLYNPETGQILTRTPKSWLLITIFYCIYYSCLAAFWYGMLTLFLSFVTVDRPRYIKEESIIGVNPGVGLQPGQDLDNIDSSMFFLTKTQEYEQPLARDVEGTRNINYAARYKVFLDKNYLARKDTSEDDEVQVVDCGGGEKPEGNVTCKFDISVLRDCQDSAANYGYTQPKGQQNGSIKPCVLLKVNRIFGWVPETYNASHLEELKELGASERLINSIRRKPNQLYVDCQGENTADREALLGNVNYFPDTQHFPIEFFPFDIVAKDEQERLYYQSPLVAVQFDGNRLPANQLLHIECKLWHQKAEHSRKDRMGLVHFELYLDD